MQDCGSHSAIAFLHLFTWTPGIGFRLAAYIGSATLQSIFLNFRESSLLPPVLSNKINSLLKEPQE